MNWRYQHTLLAAAFLACFSNNASRLVISPVLPNVIDAFDLSKSVVGLALTGMWAIYALLQFPSGVIADAVGDYRVILVSLVLTGLGSLFLALSPSFFLFGVAVLALGAGAGLYFVVGTSMLVKSFRRHGQVLGVHSGNSEWWRCNDRLRAEMELLPYVPSRNRDGTYTHEVQSSSGSAR